MAELEGQRILITGGAGFVGSHLADALSERNEVVVVDDLSTGDTRHVPDGVRFREADIHDPNTLDALTADVDLVFHEAAVVSVQRSIAEPLACHQTNTDATLQLLDLARERDFRVVLASSAAIFGHPETLPVTESDQKTPTSPYGIDKLTVDHYARAYNDLYDVETVTLRYFNIYGPRQRAGDYGGVISIFRDQALAGNPITIDGDGTQTRDFVHIDDVVDANIRAATTDHVGEAYNIGRGTQTSINELAEAMREVTESSSTITRSEPRPGDIASSVADISKARRELGFEPSVSLRDGLKTLVE